MTPGAAANWAWRRTKTAEDNDVVVASRVVEEDTDDDLEAQQRESTATGVIGSWLKALADQVYDEIADVDAAAERMGISLDNSATDQDPVADARFDALHAMIERLLRQDGHWISEERLVIFTEYKTTLDYLLRRLRQTYRKDEGRFLCLYGGMDDPQREQIKEVFNDPAAQVRVLIATDAASEGLNLQSTARYLLHYDCPWNPSRLEQRNGRLDRHGQARDVYVHYFASEQEADLKFMSYLIRKVDQIREDLGATGELFDEAIHRRLIDGEDANLVEQALELQVEQRRQSIQVDADDTYEGSAAKEKLQALSEELDLDPAAGRDTLETAMAMEVGRPQLTDPDDLERFTIRNPDLLGWKDIIDDTVRRQSRRGQLGAMPWLSFSPRPFLEAVGPRTVFRPRVDGLMLHLAHPFVQKATGALTRRRFPGPGEVSRWTVRYGEAPPGADALVLLHVEELAVNELRETFHHWVQTYALPVRGEILGDPLAHVPAIRWRQSRPCHDQSRLEYARNLLDDLTPDLQEFIKELRPRLTAKLLEQLKVDGEAARQEEIRRYQSRQAEVSTLIVENTLAKLEKQIGQLKAERAQQHMWRSQRELDELDRSIEDKQAEVERRRHHYEEVRDQLARERERITKILLPRRYALQGEGQVLPVAVEIRMPEPKGGER